MAFLNAVEKIIDQKHTKQLGWRFDACQNNSRIKDLGKVSTKLVKEINILWCIFEC